MFETDVDFDFDDESLTSSFKASEKPENPTSSKRPLADRSNHDPGKQNKVEDSILVRTRMAPRTGIKRKFPGPAGILPDCEGFDPSVMQNLGRQPVNVDGIPCTQSSLSVFEGGPWGQMTDDYPTLSSKFNIKWIKSHANANKLVNQRAPFLGAVIQDVKCFDAKHPIVNVVLKDMTGEIHGTIIHNLYEKYSSNLATGSAIVLKHFGVLTTGNKNNHHLTITHNNLAVIYSEIKNRDSEQEGNQEENTDRVKKIVMTELLDDEIALELVYYKEQEESVVPAPPINSSGFERHKFGETSRKNAVSEKDGTSANHFHSSNDHHVKPAEVSFWSKFSDNSNRMRSTNRLQSSGFSSSDISNKSAVFEKSGTGANNIHSNVGQGVTQADLNKFSENPNSMRYACSPSRLETPGSSSGVIHNNKTVFAKSGVSANPVSSNIGQLVKHCDRSEFGEHSNHERPTKPSSKPKCDDAPTKAIFESDAFGTDLQFDDNLQLPVPPVIQNDSSKKKFNFKFSKRSTNCSSVLPSDFICDKVGDPSQHSVRTSNHSHHADSRILQDALEGINADCLFDDF